MRILFWGTPDFGLPSLEALRTAGHDLVGVVTNPDRPAGRGRKLRASPVKRWAERAGVSVLQPETPRGDEFEAAVRRLDPELSVVAAYGRILRDEILALPPLGSINVHASLLPHLRGAAPVTWAIIRGDEESGVTIMRMVRELDAGPMLARASVPLGPQTTAGELYERLSRLGGETLVPVVEDLARGAAVETPQDEALATYAPKLDRDTARLDWSLPAAEVGRWMRGCDPWPGAWSRLDELTIQCFRPSVEPLDDEAEPGTVLEADPRDGLLVAAGSGAVRVGEVRPAGSRRMEAAAWIRGHGRLDGERLV